MEITNLNLQRQLMTIRNQNFMRDITAVKNGKLPPSLLPPHELLSILKDIEAMIKHHKLQVKHITSTKNAYLMYQYITPFIIINSENYEILLFMILPLVPSDAQLSLYQVSTIPFDTQEAIPMILDLPYPYFVSDFAGTQHTLLSEADLQSCTKYDEMTLCTTPQPLVTERSLCYSSLHFEGDNTDLIYASCRFRKANSNQAKFLSIAPNRFAYFVPRATKLYISCPETGYSNVTEISRSGNFQFPNRCFARINNFIFHDTTLEALNQSFIPQKQLLSFLDVARGNWPAAASASFADLLHAASDTNASEPLASIGTRAKIYHVLADLLHLNAEQDNVKEIYRQICYFLTSLAVPIILGIFYSIWFKIYYKCQRKQHPPIPPPKLPALWTKSQIQLAPEEQPRGRQSPVHLRRLEPLHQHDHAVMSGKVTFEQNCAATLAAATIPTISQNVYATTNDNEYDFYQQQQLSRSIDEFNAKHIYTKINPAIEKGKV